MAEKFDALKKEESFDFDFEDMEELGGLWEEGSSALGLDPNQDETDGGEWSEGGTPDGQGLETYADIVFCIDCTGSMVPVLERVKATALGFHDQLIAALAERGREVRQLRIKVIGFRDMYVDAKPFEESAFFLLPQETDAFRKFVNALKPTGGGDSPESGLEALVKAVKSDWTQEGIKRRHIIAVFTDDSAHKLEKDIDGIAPDMPKSLDEAETLWSASSQEVEGLKLSQSDKRLVLFAPNRYPWTDINEDWDLVWHKICAGGAGLEDVEMDTIINFLAKSF